MFRQANILQPLLVVYNGILCQLKNFHCWTKNDGGKKRIPGRQDVAHTGDITNRRDVELLDFWTTTGKIILEEKLSSLSFMLRWRKCLSSMLTIKLERHVLRWQANILYHGNCKSPMLQMKRKMHRVYVRFSSELGNSEKKRSSSYKPRLI